MQVYLLDPPLPIHTLADKVYYSWPTGFLNLLVSLSKF